jgi:hypothetical protein
MILNSLIIMTEIVHEQANLGSKYPTCHAFQSKINSSVSENQIFLNYF